MKPRLPLTFAAIALLLSGCIPSVNPFYTAKDLVFNPGLLGEWQAKESSEEMQFWKFEKGDEKTYQLTVTEKGGKSGKFTAHLFTLKQELFLDLIPDDCDFAEDQADLVAASMFSGHLLARVSATAPELKIAFCDFEWLQKHLESHPKAVAHHLEKNHILLTASTRDLQRFVLKHLAPGELFQQPSTMVRKPTPTAR